MSDFKYKVIYKLGNMQKEFKTITYTNAKTIKKECEEYGYTAKIVKL